MARVERLAAAGRGGPAAASNESLPASKSSRKHKVVVESVTQEKKKLRQVITFNPKPPAGYTFIPAGNPALTTALKEAARKAGSPVYTVTTTPHAKVHDLSQQVHRIGYHFSSPVVADVCNDLGIQLSSTGHVIGKGYETFLKGYRNRGAPGAEEDGWDQTTLNTKARDAIKDLFPNIPNKDLFQIIKTAFQKGKRRVGTASELPLARRAQLAVVAHIRHCYTLYDKLLRSGGYHDARGVVEKPTLEKLVEWRGDDENGAKILEDVIREVVVISDDEDSDDDDYDPEAPLKELSVEVVPRIAEVNSRQIRPDHQRRISGHQGERLTISDDDTPPDVQFIARRPRRYEEERISDRRGVVHNQVWNAAREQFRADPHRYATGPGPYSTHGPPSFAPPHANGDDSHEERNLYSGVTSNPNIQNQRQQPPAIIRGSDGAIYTRVPSPPPPRFVGHPHSKLEPHSSAVPYDPSRPMIPEHLRIPLPIPHHASAQFPHDHYVKESDVALPSIERDHPIPATSNRRVDEDHGRSYPGDRPITPPQYRNADRSIDLTNSSERPQAKKRRYDETFGTNGESGPPLSCLLHQDSGYSYQQPLRRMELPDTHDSLRDERRRGKDEIASDYRRPEAYRGPMPDGRHFLESVHAPTRSLPSDFPFRGGFQSSHEYDQARQDRENYRPSHTYLVPMDSHRPVGFSDQALRPPPVGVREIRPDQEGRPLRYYAEPDSGGNDQKRIIRYDDPLEELSRMAPYREHGPAVERIAHRDFVSAGDAPRYREAGHAAPPVLRPNDRFGHPSDALPPHMERLTFDQPGHSQRHGEPGRVDMQPRRDFYEHRGPDAERYAPSMYHPPQPPLPVQRDPVPRPPYHNPY